MKKISTKLEATIGVLYTERQKIAPWLLVLVLRYNLGFGGYKFSIPPLIYAH